MKNTNTKTIKGNSIIKGFEMNMSISIASMSHESEKSEYKQNRRIVRNSLNGLNFNSNAKADECSLDMILDLIENTKEQVKEVVAVEEDPNKIKAQRLASIDNDIQALHKERRELKKDVVKAIKEKSEIKEVNPSLQEQLDEFNQLKKRMEELEMSITNTMNSNYIPEWEEGKEF